MPGRLCSLARVLRVVGQLVSVTITQCETAADLLHAGSGTLLVDRTDRGDGHNPRNSGDPRLRRFTTYSRVEIQWVTSNLTVRFSTAFRWNGMEHCYFGFRSRDIATVAILA